MEPDVAPDGSPVPVFRVLEPPAVVLDAVAAGSVLDLGCGAGRIANALGARGHAVVGVDVAPAMLAWVAGPRVCADIRALPLNHRFDTVLLASYLVNDADGGAFLTACRAHVTDDGAVIVQRYSPDWARDAVDDAAVLGEVAIAVHDFRLAPTSFDAVVTYTVGDAAWDQPIRGVILDDEALMSLAADAGLRFERWLDQWDTWAVLRVGTLTS